MKKDILLDVEGLNIYMKESGQVYQVCSGVNLRIPRETTVSIVGESGCGKSLTCSAVMGLLNPPKWKVEGRMVFEGEPLTVQNDRFMNRIRGNAVALVAQDPMSAFDQRMTIRSHFMEIRGNRLKSKKEVLMQAEELLLHMNIRTPKDVLKCYPFQLSGGMLQRVLIAMAVSTSPSLLIADEPTTALDVTNQQELLHLLKKMKEEEKLSVLLVSHDLNLISRMADEMNVMYAGMVVEKGTTHEIMEHPLHPYTKALLQSRPAFSKKRLPVLEGQPPALAERKRGCPFQSRCSQKKECCQNQMPPETEPIPGHFVRCFVEESCY